MGLSIGGKKVPFSSVGFLHFHIISAMYIFMDPGKNKHTKESVVTLSLELLAHTTEKQRVVNLEGPQVSSVKSSRGAEPSTAAPRQQLASSCGERYSLVVHGPAGDVPHDSFHVPI